MTSSYGAQTQFSVRVRRSVVRLTMTCGAVLMGLSTASADITIPDTPAGKAVSAWLTPFTSGDHAQLDDYLKTYEPSRHAVDFMSFRDRVGGFDLLSIEKSQPNRIVLLLKERNGDGRALAKFQVSDSKSAASDEFRGPAHFQWGCRHRF